MTATARILIAAEIKAAGNSGELEGWASVFGNRDSQGDHVQPGAFRKSIGDIEASGRGLAMLWQHIGSEPVGLWTSVKEEPRGLRVKGHMLGLETDIGRYRYELVKGGALNGLSIGYTDSVRRQRKGGGYDLVGLTLIETSLVTFPSNDRARIVAVKGSADDLENPRWLERYLRDGGYSFERAKGIVAAGLKLKTTTSVRDGDGRVNLAELIRSASSRLEQHHGRRTGIRLSGGTGARGS